MDAVSPNPYEVIGTISMPMSRIVWTQWFPRSVSTRISQFVVITILGIIGFFCGPHLLMLDHHLLSAIFTPIKVVHCGTWEDGASELVESGLMPLLFLLPPLVAGLFRVHRHWILCLTGFPIGFFLYESWSYQENGYGKIAFWYAAHESLLPSMALLLGVAAAAYVRERTMPNLQRMDFALLLALLGGITVAVLSSNREVVFWAMSIGLVTAIGRSLALLAQSDIRRTIACTRVRESGGFANENLSRVPCDA